MTKGNKQEFMNNRWFEDQKQEHVDLLVTAIKRQANLEKLLL